MTEFNTRFFSVAIVLILFGLIMRLVMTWSLNRKKENWEERLLLRLKRLFQKVEM